MMRRPSLTIVLLLVVALAAAGCSLAFGSPVPNGNGGGDGPDVVAESDQIKVYTPAPHQVVKGSFELTGIAQVYEATVRYELRQGTSVLVEGFTTATDWDWGSFAATIVLPHGASGDGVLRIYAESAEDGTPMHLVEIPLTLAEPEVVASSQQIKVFSPAPNQSVSGSFDLLGIAQVYEATVSYDLTVNGQLVVEDFTTASDFDWGTFHAQVNLPVGVSGDGVLRIYSESAEDGSATFVVTIPLTVTPAQ